MTDTPTRLVRLAQQLEDQHAPQHMTILMREAAARIEQLEAALREIAKYEIEDGCPCNACQHSAIARAALGEKA